ncbi:uncharacterized protein LOC118438854 [Folsomia candida]|uniref:uncharacterized protein LOC118438854 n=1 Tax=Folsomia candida TaxID=158441 RepID=UPI0016050CBB|nr:uncharacterized protein LOC118438854 [Folsomia candida]
MMGHQKLLFFAVSSILTTLLHPPPTTAQQMDPQNLALFMTMSDFDNNKMFYKPGEETWEMADYGKSLKSIKEYEFIVSVLKAGGNDSTNRCRFPRSLRCP